MNKLILEDNQSISEDSKNDFHNKKKKLNQQMCESVF